MRRRQDAPLTDGPFYSIAKCEVCLYYYDKYGVGGVLVHLHEMQNERLTVKIANVCDHVFPHLLLSNQCFCLFLYLLQYGGYVPFCS